MRNMRREQVKQNRKRRRLVYLTFGILLFIYLTLNMIIGENGLLRYTKLKSTRDIRVAETRALEKQNEDVRKQIEALKNDPDLVEELAREYGFTKKDEMIFKFEDKQ
jgi:cell division protein FtsB